MRILYWILGIVAIAFVIYYGFYYEADTASTLTNTTTTSDTVDSDSVTEQPIVVDDETTNNQPTDNQPDIAASDLKTFSNEVYDFAFNFDKDYYWNATRSDHAINITNNKDLSELSYQGYISDAADDFRIEFNTFNIGNQSLDDYALENVYDDPSREVDVSTFEANNITGKEYFIHKSTDPNIGPGVNYEARFVLFKNGNYLYSFLIDGNNKLRDEVISTFRTI